MLQYALVDLDDTVYAAQCGLWPAIGERIERYMIERVGLAPDGLRALRRRYLEQYGTALNGLRAEHAVDAADFLAYVHDLLLEQFLQPSPELDAMLAGLPLRKAIFTNADAAHAKRVLARLAVAHRFDQVIDVTEQGYVCKPDRRAYLQVLERLGVPPEACVFVDDAPRNLRPARQLGMLTVLVGTPAAEPKASEDPLDYEFRIPSILDLHTELAAAGWLPKPERRPSA